MATAQDLITLGKAMFNDMPPAERNRLRRHIGMDAAPRRRGASDDASPSAEEMVQNIKAWLIDVYNRGDRDAASQLLDGLDELCGDPRHPGGEDRRARRMGRDLEPDGHNPADNPYGREFNPAHVTPGAFDSRSRMDRVAARKQGAAARAKLGEKFNLPARARHV